MKLSIISDRLRKEDIGVIRRRFRTNLSAIEQLFLSDNRSAVIHTVYGNGHPMEKLPSLPLASPVKPGLAQTTEERQFNNIGKW